MTTKPMFYILTATSRDERWGTRDEVALWWKKDRHGYTYDINHALLVTEDEANHLVRDGVDFAIPATRVQDVSHKMALLEDVWCYQLNKAKI